MSHPALVALEAGTHALCVCGQSQNGVFCDGSHQGSGLTPYILKLDTAKTVALCNCGHSASKPFCDGSHAKINQEPASP